MEKNILNDGGANVLPHSCHGLIKHQPSSHKSQLCVKGEVELLEHPRLHFFSLFFKSNRQTLPEKGHIFLQVQYFYSEDGCRKDINLLEQVQKTATKMIIGVEYLCCEHHLSLF